MNAEIQQSWVQKNEGALDKFFSKMKAVRQEQSAVVLKANLAMERLAKVLCTRSGQPYRLRALLFSLYNGKPVSLLEVVSFDWQIKKDLVDVIAAFGCSGFFYAELKAAVVAVGQWDWFTEEGGDAK